VYPANAVDGLI